MLVSTSCGCSSEMNKSSPPPSSPLTNLGYSKLSLPPLRNSPAFLRRCVSDLSSPPPPPHHPNPFADRKAVSLPQSPERKVSAFNSSLLPPLPPPPHLSRTNSDLSPSPAKTFSRSASSNDMSLESDDTPNSKKLKRMRGGIKEVIDWCNRYVLDEDLKQEDEQQLDGGVTQDVPDIDAPQDVPDIDTTQDLHDDTCIEDSCEREFSESVSVEKKDDSLVIHFRCHCNKGYQFLLNGGDCYYKLM